MTTSRPTVASLAARMDAQETALAEIASALQGITALLQPEAPARTRKAPAKRAAKPKASAQRKSDRLAGGKGPRVAAVTPAQPKALCKSTRVAFVAAARDAGTDFAGMSTKAIAAMCLKDASLVPAGFRIGEGYAALLG